MAAQRDAKALRSPDTFNVMRWHAVVGGQAACNSRAILDLATQQPAAGVHRDLRCSNNACRRSFEEADRHAKEDEHRKAKNP